MITIDAKCFTSKLETHDALRAVLGEEDYWGNNLDALHDKLTSIFTPTTIVIKNWGCALRSIGEYADRLWHVFDDATEENPNLNIVIE